MEDVSKDSMPVHSTLAVGLLNEMRIKREEVSNREQQLMLKEARLVAIEKNLID